MLRFAVTIFLSAFLLFQIQPMIGKYILPWFGGSAGVWTTCMLFFQVLLLFGYAYAHFLSSRVPWKMQGWVHLAVLAATIYFLPIGPDADVWKPQSADDPIGRILFMLLANIGLPYFLLSSTGPLLQSWFSGACPGRSPYRLYSLSNFASLLALASYPLWFERIAGVNTQVQWWSIGFVGFLLACGWCAIRVARSEPVLHSGEPDAALAAVDGQPVPRDASPSAPRPNFGRVVMWVALAASASAMLLATTNQLTQEVASVPFLWVLPLILYLLSFIICFDNERWYSRRIFGGLLLVSVPLAVVLLYVGVDGKLWVQIAIYSTALFACCMTCHGELVKTKPDPKHLTLFYLTVSAGGAIGGAFVAIVAPNVFTGYYEYQVAVVVCVAATFLAWFVQRRTLDESPNLYLRYGIALFAGLFVMFCATAVNDEPFHFWPWEELPEKTNLLPFGEQCWEQLKTTTFTFNLFGDKPTTVFLWVLMSVWAVGVVAGFVFEMFIFRILRSPLLSWMAAPVAVLLLVAALLAQTRHAYEDSIFVTRNFYGVMRVEETEKYAWFSDEQSVAIQWWPRKQFMPLVDLTFSVNKKGEAYIELGKVRRLIHGRILHGVQFLDPDKRRWHSSYYSDGSGVGMALNHHPNRFNADPDQRGIDIGLIGLGTGTIATYAEEKDTLRIYEINPMVEEVARNPKFFSYLADSPSQPPEGPQVVLGDARIQLELEKKANKLNAFDVMIVDAFSSDAIPLHLLTKECVQLYFDHLNQTPGNEGLLAIHISNRFVDLNPVIRGLVQEFNCHVIRVSIRDIPRLGVSGSTWVVLTYNDTFAEDPSVILTDDGFENTKKRPPVLWTDDRTSLWELLNF